MWRNTQQIKEISQKYQHKKGAARQRVHLSIQHFPVIVGSSKPKELVDLLPNVQQRPTLFGGSTAGLLLLYARDDMDVSMPTGRASISRESHIINRLSQRPQTWHSKVWSFTNYYYSKYFYIRNNPAPVLGTWGSTG